MKDIKSMLYTPDNKKKVVTFVRYHDGNLWYVTECNFEFPVPISDAGNATFLAIDVAPLFMRYIRKHLQIVEQV